MDDTNLAAGDARDVVQRSGKGRRQAVEDAAHEGRPTLASDPKYANLKLVETVYGDDDATESTQQAKALLTTYPDLKAILAPTTVGGLAAQVVSQAGKSDWSR